MANTYSTGTVAVVQGSKAVTITGGLSISINMKPDDFIAIEGGLPNAIESLTDNTHFQLVRPFDGPTDAAASYIVIHMPTGWGDRVALNEQTAEVIRLLGVDIPFTQSQLDAANAAAATAATKAAEANASKLAAAQSETNANTAAGMATAKAAEVTGAYDLVVPVRDQAIAAKNAAVLAAELAAVTGPKYIDEPTGRAAVADGATFLVQGAGKVAAYEYRRVGAAVPSTLIASYFDGKAFADVRGVDSVMASLGLERVGGGSIAGTTLTYPAPGVAQLQFSSASISYSAPLPDVFLPADVDSSVTMFLSSDPTTTGGGQVGLAVGASGGDRLHFMYAASGTVYTSPETWVATTLSSAMAVWTPGSTVAITIFRRKDGSGYVAFTGPDGVTKRRYRTKAGTAFASIPSGQISFTGRLSSAGTAKLRATGVSTSGVSKINRDDLAPLLGDINSAIGAAPVTGLVAMHDVLDRPSTVGGRVKEWASSVGRAAVQTAVALQPVLLSRGLIFQGGQCLTVNQRSDTILAEFVRTTKLSAPPSGNGPPDGVVCTGAFLDQYGTPYIINDGRATESPSGYRPGLLKMTPDYREYLEERQLSALFTPTVGSAQGSAFDFSDNTAWVVDVANKMLRHINLDGTDAGGSIGPLAFTPNGLARNHAGDFLYVKDATTSTVYEIRCSDGTQIRTWLGTSATDQMFYNDAQKLLYMTSGANGTNGVVSVWQPHTVRQIATILTPKMSQAPEAIIVEGRKMTLFNDGKFHTTANPPLCLVSEYYIPEFDPQVVSEEIMIGGIVSQLTASTGALFSIDNPLSATLSTGGVAVYYSTTANRITVVAKSCGSTDSLVWQFSGLNISAEPFIWVAVLDRVGNTVKLYINGVEATPTSTSGTAGALVNPFYLSRYQIGSDLAQATGISTNFVNAEVRFMGLASSKTDRQKMEGWLGWRDSRVTLLPADHPYKAAYPV